MHFPAWEKKIRWHNPEALLNFVSTQRRCSLIKSSSAKGLIAWVVCDALCKEALARDLNQAESRYVENTTTKTTHVSWHTPKHDFPSPSSVKTLLYIAFLEISAGVIPIGRDPRNEDHNYGSTQANHLLAGG